MQRHFYQYQENGFLNGYVCLRTAGMNPPECERQVELPFELPEGDKMLLDGKVYFCTFDEVGNPIAGEEICSL
jgi:hypothetical protein